MRRWEFLPGRFDSPDFPSVFGDRSVRRKLPGRRDVQESHLQPLLLVTVGLRDAVLALHVGFVVGEKEEPEEEENRFHSFSSRICQAAAAVLYLKFLFLTSANPTDETEV